METLIAKALPGLGAIFSKGWFAAMGVTGLILLLGLLLFGTPYDPRLVASIAAMLIGLGFGEAECRTHIQSIRPHSSGTYTVTRPHWRLTLFGAILHVIGWIGAIKTGVILLFS